MIKSKKAFTLVELVIVIAILAILAAIAVPTVSHLIAQAKRAQGLSNIKTIEMAYRVSLADLKMGGLGDRLWVPSQFPGLPNAGDYLKLENEIKKILGKDMEGKYQLIVEGSKALAKAGDIHIYYAPDGLSTNTGFTYYNGVITEGDFVWLG